MNEKRIEQVMQIEKQAQQILDGAKQSASEIPVQAEREAQAQLEKALAEAQAEASKLLAAASAQDETARILAEAEQKSRSAAEQAAKNLDRAVAFVLDRVLGKA